MINFILENFDTIFKNKTSLETLDKVILDLAIKGKLVEQNQDDEPASELIKRIKAEKQRLIDEKVIKKEKPLPPIEDEEIPFEIPNNWEWVRLGNIIQVINGYAYKSNEYVKESKYQLIRLGNVKNNFLKLNISEIYLDKTVIEKTDLQRIKENDILVTLTGTRGRRDYFYTVRVSENDLKSKELYLNQRVGNLRIFKEIESKYINILLKSSYILDKIFLTETGTANQGNIGTEEVKKLVLCIPPIEEQKRIVSKVEKLQSIIKDLKEIYIKNQNNRENLKKSLLSEIESQSSDKDLLKNLETVFTNFDKIIKTKEDIKDIRNLILSLAIKGKLVEQNQDDEKASELIKRIKAEKQRLIDEKVIKKEKPLPPIEDEEIPFDIPNNWEWVRLGELGNIFNGNSINEKVKKEKYEDIPNGLNYIATKDIVYPTSIINYNNGIKIPFEELNKFRIAHKNSVLICSEGGSAGKKIGITEEDICFGNKLYALESFSEELDNKYIFYVYNSSYFYKNFKGNETGIIGGVSVNKFKNIEIPLPPIEEQKRIVSKVESLMKICDLLEEKITLNEKISDKLLESLTK